jgi:1,4-alpha-glucan branching enzyme
MVQLVGDFNHWHPILMKRNTGGFWFIQLRLHQGRHEYRFLVDGEPTLDLHATRIGRGHHDQPVSIIAVS